MGLHELSYFRIEPKPEQIRSEPAIKNGRIFAPTRIFRFGGARVVARSAFEVEPDREEEILRHSSRTPPGMVGGERRAVNAAVLRALHAHAALQAEAARFEIRAATSTRESPSAARSRRPTCSAS